MCRSDGDPKCADPFDNTSFPITDCAQEKPRDHLPGLEATMCRKVRQKVNGNWRYIRSCAWLGEPGIGRDERYCTHRSGTCCCLRTATTEGAEEAGRDGSVEGAWLSDVTVQVELLDRGQRLEPWGAGQLGLLLGVQRGKVRGEEAAALRVDAHLGALRSQVRVRGSA